MIRSGMSRLLTAMAVVAALSALILSGLWLGPVTAEGATPAVSRLWVSRYMGPVGNDKATAEAVSPDGSRVFVTGTSDGTLGGTSYATVAYDAATGAERWVARYNGPGDGVDSAFSLAVSPDGSRVFVTGTSDGTLGGTSYATVAYDAATGAELWVRRYNGPGNGEDRAAALGVSPDGTKVFVTGASFRGETSFDYATVAYDAATGAQRWVALYNAPEGGADLAKALGVSPDGSRVFVTGESGRCSRSLCDYATVAYDAATGSQQWVARYNGPGNFDDVATALAVNPNGSQVFVTGWSFGLDGADYATLAYDSATGVQQWVKRYNGPHFPSLATALAVSPDGSRVFVTGLSENLLEHFEYATLAYDSATGARQWLQRYSKFSDSGASSVAVSPDGSQVFVTGAVGPNYGTVAYVATTGAKQWAKQYNDKGNGEDRAAVVAVSPDGTKVFVTGESQRGLDSDFDYATVAYLR